MPCFAMLSSCSMLIYFSEHCYLMMFQACPVISLSLWTWYLLHFFHACLSLLFCDLAVAQCSSFVKHLEWITAMCFVAMLECSSLVSCCILDGIMLLITELYHYCFACNLQTVHPIPVILISISTEINSSFQRRSCFAKLRPGSIFSFRSTHMHCILHPAYHAMFCIMLLAHCTVVDCVSLACVLVLGRAERQVRDRGNHWVRLRGSSLRQLGELCRQDNHTLEITSIFAC